MARVLVTGMSGTGKSSALVELGRRGHCVVDTDAPAWSRWFPPAGDAPGEWRWREDRMADLLASAEGGTLYVSGCMSNQAIFYDRFEAVVLLSAPSDVILERIEARATNDYGKDPAERALVLHHLATVEPLLRASATHEIDASRSLTEVVAELVEIGEAPSPRRRP